MATTDPFAEFGGQAITDAPAAPSQSTDPFAEFGGHALPATSAPASTLDPFAEFGGHALPASKPVAPADPFAEFGGRALTPPIIPAPSPLVQTQPTFTLPQQSAAPAQPPAPSTWQKIKAFATHPLVSLEMMPELGLPIEAAESAEKYLNANNHPTLAKAAAGYAGAQKAVAENVSAATSPLGIGTLLATGGLSSMEGVAGPVIARLVNLGLSGQQIAAAYQNVPEIRKALQTGDVENAARLITSSLGNVALATWSGLHSLGTVEPTSSGTEPLSKAPVVKIVDSDAAKAHAEQGSNGTAPTAKPATEPITYRTDSNGVKWAKVSPDLPEVSIPSRLTDPAEIEAEARQKAELQRQFIASHSARVVPDDHVPTVSKDEILAEASARILHNAPVLQNIIDPTKLNSADDIRAALQQASEHITNNLDPRVGVRISFAAQKQLASDLGLSIEELLNRQSGAASNAETSLASRAMLQSSANNVLDLAKKAAAGDSDARTQLGFSIARHQEIENQIAGVRSETGRALGSWRIPDSDLPAVKISRAMSQLKPEALDKATQLLARLDPTDTQAVNNFIRQIEPSSTPEKLYEWYRAALLSGPQTVTKKAASEFTLAALEGLRKAGVGVAERAKQAAGISDAEAYPSEAYYYSKGFAMALANARKILNGEFTLQGMPDLENLGRKESIKGRLGQIVRAPGNLLKKQTTLLYAANYFGELNSLAARQAISEGLSGQQLSARQDWLAHNPSLEMQQAANKQALYGTFQSRLSVSGEALGQAIQQSPWAKWLFPFYRTPINIFKTATEFSPYGVLKGTIRGDANEQVRGMLGSTIAGALGYLAVNNYVSGGGPLNYKQRQTRESTGWQPYSVRIGNKWYSYARLEPVSLVLGLTADAVHGSLHDEDPAVSNAKSVNLIGHISRNVQNLPFLMQLSEVADSLTNLGRGNTAERAIDNLLASAVVPSPVRDVAQATDRTVRSPQQQGLLTNPLPGAVQTVESRVPGLTNRVPADIDVTGQTLQRPVSALGGANPFPWTVAKNDPVTAEMARLGISAAPVVKTVKRVGTSKSAPSWTLSDDESRQLQLQDTRALYTWLQQKIASPDWARMKDDRRKELIDSERRRIVGTRFSRVARMRREQSVTVAASN